MGSGTTGLDRLDYMRASTNEATNAQGAANSMFANHGKPAASLMIDRVLNKEQRSAISRTFRKWQKAEQAGCTCWKPTRNTSS